ncbi:MAG: family 10 glycosylhydrolase [Ruminococcus sp.]|nr:family 10 glycosylhydrolase [Ruminococcus sp.]
MRYRKFKGTFVAYWTAALLAILPMTGCMQVSDEMPEDMTDLQSAADSFPGGYESIAETVMRGYEGTPSEETLPETARTSPKTDESPQVSSSGTFTDISRITGGGGTAGYTSANVSETVSDTTADSVVTASEPPVTEADSGTTSAQIVSRKDMGEVTVVTIPKVKVTEATLSVGGAFPDSDTVTENGGYAEGGYYPVSGYYPLNFETQKAVWFSYLEYDRLMRGKTREEFTAGLGDCFENAAALGINTIYFQVRAYGDAYYDSSLYPKADRLTGDYDPLAIAVKEAHDRGLSIHAWVNPMRLMTDQQMQGVSGEYLMGQWYADDNARGTVIVNHAGRWYLSPAYSEAVSLICEGVKEIVSHYDVDGVQIDDYFYPTTDGYFDKAAYETSGSTLSLDDWRREKVTEMVKSIYKAVHSANPNAVFGISPSGNVTNDRNELYADVERWLSEASCCDYICPQIYYGFENEALPFEKACREWAGLIKRDDIRLVIGLAAYKSGTEDKYAGAGKYEWTEHTDILSRQLQTAASYSAGAAFFRYDSLFLPDPSVSVYVQGEMDALIKSAG